MTPYTSNRKILQAYQKMYEAANPDGTIDDKSRYKEICSGVAQVLYKNVAKCVSEFISDYKFAYGKSFQEYMEKDLEKQGKFIHNKYTIKIAGYSRQYPDIRITYSGDDITNDDIKEGVNAKSAIISLAYYRIHEDSVLGIKDLEKMLYSENAVYITRSSDGHMTFELNKSVDINLRDVVITIDSGYTINSDNVLLKHTFTNLNDEDRILTYSKGEQPFRDFAISDRKLSVKSDAFRKNLSSPKFPDKQRDDEDKKHTEEDYQDY
jgi:hypothetical protein